MQIPPRSKIRITIVILSAAEKSDFFGGVEEDSIPPV